jgi:hypothetical protein
MDRHQPQLGGTPLRDTKKNVGLWREIPNSWRGVARFSERFSDKTHGTLSGLIRRNQDRWPSSFFTGNRMGNSPKTTQDAGSLTNELRVAMRSVRLPPLSAGSKISLTCMSGSMCMTGRARDASSEHLLSWRNPSGSACQGPDDLQSDRPIEPGLAAVSTLGAPPDEATALRRSPPRVSPLRP